MTSKQKKGMAITAAVLLLCLGVGKGISDGDIANPIDIVNANINKFKADQEKKAAQKAWESEKIDDGTGNMKTRYDITRLMYASNTGDALENLIAAQGMNSDSMAWITIPDTDINGAVMQGMDNDFYLRRDENKDYDVYGCYFLDYESRMGSADKLSQNTIIYGHSDSTDNPNGKRFAQLYRFTEEDFADKVKEVTITTTSGVHVFEIFSVFYTDTDFKYNQVYMTDQEKLQLATQAKSLSIRDYGITPTLDDKLLTLSTCTVLYGTSNHRFVVMGRLKK